MTDEEIRIAIAGACGLTKFKPFRYATRNGRLLEPGEKGVRLMYCSGGTNGWQDWEDVPNYPECLNAMHEAVMSLPLKQWDNYELELAVVVFGPHMRHTVRYQHFATTNATARQRAEAFLRTLNLRKD